MHASSHRISSNAGVRGHHHQSGRFVPHHHGRGGQGFHGGRGSRRPAGSATGRGNGPCQWQQHLPQQRRRPARAGAPWRVQQATAWEGSRGPAHAIATSATCSTAATYARSTISSKSGTTTRSRADATRDPPTDRTLF